MCGRWAGVGSIPGEETGFVGKIFCRIDDTDAPTDLVRLSDSASLTGLM